MSVQACNVDLLICVVHTVGSANNHAGVQVVSEIVVVLFEISDAPEWFIVLDPKSNIPGLVVGPAVVKLINC